MPLTSKGKKIIAAMVKQYGKKRGKEVFYASKNKGTIEGVEKTEEIKMNYIDKVLSLEEEERDVDKIKKIDVTRRLSSGRTRTRRVGGRLARGAVKAALKTADWDTDQSGRQADNIEVPERRGQEGRGGKKKGQYNTSINVVDHAVYKQMGVLIAEALGHRVDEIAPVLAAPLGLAARAAAVGGRLAAKTAGKVAKAGVKTAGKVAKAGVKAAGQATKAGGRMAKDYVEYKAAEAAKEKLKNKLAGPEEESEDE